MEELIFMEEKVDLIFSDLPYGSTNCKWDSPLNLSDLWPLLWKVLKPSGAIVLFAQSPFDKILGASQIKYFRYEWIWEKTLATGHLNAKKMPMKAHENILVFYKKLATFHPQMTFGHERKISTKEHKRNTPKGDIYGKCKELTSYDSTERYPRSVQKFPSDRQKINLHSTQKPLALCEYIIKTYTNKNDTVLDICMGSGTVGVAAKKNDRNFIGIENDLIIFKSAQKRISSKELV